MKGHYKKHKRKRELWKLGYEVDSHGDNTPYHRLGGLVYTMPYWYCQSKKETAAKSSNSQSRKGKRAKR